MSLVLLITLTFSADFDDKLPWQGLDLDSGAVVSEPRFDAPNWDLRLRQGYVGTNRASVAKIDTADFDSVKQPPSDASAYEADSKYDPSGPAGDDTYNKTLMSWYDYFFLEGHLMAPHPKVFVVKTSNGRFAKVQFVDYIKNGKAIRWVEDTDWLGRKRKKQRAVKVGDEDGKVHVKLRYQLF